MRLRQRFAQFEAQRKQNGAQNAMVSVTVTGRLTRTRASGTLSAVVKLTDAATGAAAVLSLAPSTTTITSVCRPAASAGIAAMTSATVGSSL